MTARKDRIFHLTHIKNYLNELGLLLGQPVTEDQLVPADQTEILLGEKREEKPAKTLSIPFEQRTSAEFRHLMDQIADITDDGFYLWVKDSAELGPIHVPSAKDIRFDIDFTDISGEIILLTSKSGMHQILFDFVQDDDGHQTFEIDLFGQDWGNLDCRGFTVLAE